MIYLGVVLAVLFSTGPSTATAPSNPVLLIPGLGGSRIEGKLNLSHVSHFYCTKQTSDWTLLWLSIEYLAVEFINCFSEIFTLQYDPKTHRTSNPAGVETREPGFGNTSTTEWLGTFHTVHQERYFVDIVTTLVKYGYERGLSVRAAPYDFRRAANEHAEYFTKLKGLVEEMYQQNQQRPVVLLSHSMGGLQTLYFLQQQPADWKANYIKSWLSLSGPWDGAVKSLKLMTSGDKLGDFMVSDLQIRPVQRAMVSSAWLMPSRRVWGRDDVLVSVPGGRNYTALQYDDLFTNMNFSTGYQMYLDTKDLVPIETPPGVEVYCVHGVNVSTMSGIVYPGGPETFPDGSVQLTMGPGDGTVNLRSAQSCTEWKTKQKQPFHYKTIANAEHTDILKSPIMLEYLMNDVLGIKLKKLDRENKLLQLSRHVQDTFDGRWSSGRKRLVDRL